MANQPFGVSFLPGGDAKYAREGNSATAPLQEAVKVLSLRVPRVVGASPLAPLALLTGQGGGGLPSGIVETLLRALAPPVEAPPVAAVPQPGLGVNAPPAGSQPVPQPSQPPAPGVMPPTLPVRPQVSGAPSGTPQGRQMAQPAYANVPMVNVTAGARETPPEAPPLGYQPPEQPTTPNPSLTAPSPAEEFWRIARERMGRLGA